MKKIFLTTSVALIAGLFISAKATVNPAKMDKETRKQIRKEKREERRELWLHSVNTITEIHFYTDFPNAKDVSWTEGNFAEATFLDAGTLKTAYYDFDNNLVGTTTLVDVATLPEKAKQFIAKKYPDYSVKKVILFDDNEANDTDMILYSGSFKDEDNYFPVLTNGTKELILKVAMNGDASFFKQVK
ncbi:MAG: hypothetical protein WDO71_04255 [Bacteroidota bacterium]